MREAQIRARSRMYMNSAREAFERAKMRSYGIPDLPGWPGDGSTECLTNCRCSWRYVVMPDGINCYWEIDWDAENCQDCIDRHFKWYPYFAKPALMPPLAPPPMNLFPRSHKAKLISQPASSLYDVHRIQGTLGVLLGKIPDRHLGQIADILITEPPVDYIWVPDANCWAKLIPGEGPRGCYTGLYHKGAKIIYIHPNSLVGGTTLNREIAFSLIESWAFSVFTPRILTPVFQFGMPGRNWSEIGLRLRSFYNAFEFATDTYQVWMSGSDEQFAVLSSVLLEQGVNLEGIFGGRQ